MGRKHCVVNGLAPALPNRSAQRSAAKPKLVARKALVVKASAKGPQQAQKVSAAATLGLALFATSEYDECALRRVMPSKADTF